MVKQANENACRTEKAWRDGEYLVIHEKKAVLPNRCVICNTPIDGKLTKLSVRNDSPIVQVMILLASPFASALAPRTNFRIGLCHKHIGLETVCQRIFQGLMCSSFLGIIIGFALIISESTAGIKYMGLAAIMVSIPVIYIAIFFGFGRSRPVQLAKIEEPFIWIKNASPEYLELFPEVPQP